MSDYLSRLAGTLLGFFRIGSLRLKDVGGALVLRNAGDTAHAGLEVASLKVTTGAASGRVLTSDAGGAATWQAAGTVLDGASISGLKGPGKILVMNQSGHDYASDPVIEGFYADTLSNGRYGSQEERVTVGSSSLRIQSVECYLFNAATYTFEIWNSAQTSLLVSSGSYVKSADGDETHLFFLPTAFDADPGAVFYFRLAKDVNTRLRYRDTPSDIATSHLTFSNQGCPMGDIHGDPMHVNFLVGTLHNGWEYQDLTLSKVSNVPVSSPPTLAELNSAFGAPAVVGDGVITLLDDNGAGATVYLCLVKNNAWWYLPLTKAT